jgi:hypothetical protein
MRAMLRRVESVSGKTQRRGFEFRTRLLECSTKTKYNLQAEVSFLSRDATVRYSATRLNPQAEVRISTCSALEGK